MALKLTLQGTTPGSGQLIIQGAGIAAQPLEISIQRNQDERFLAAGGGWQSTASWYPLDDVREQGNLLVAGVGSHIIDGLVSASGMMFIAGIRSEGYQGQQVLKISGRLLGSGAAGDMPEELTPVIAPPVVTEPEPPVEESRAEPHDPPAEADPEPETDADAIAPEEIRDEDGRIAPRMSLPEEPDSPHTEDGDEDEPEVPAPAPGFFRRFWYLWLALLLVLLVAVGLYFWWQAPWQGSSGNNADAPPAAAGTVVSSSDGLTGRARVSRFLEQQPDMASIRKTAAAWEQDNDCEAVRILLNMTASSDPETALSLARLYDPAARDQSACSNPDAETASYWYEQPAAQGNLLAQERLGILLTSANASGPLYDKGVLHLKDAAGNGSTAAREQLQKLGEKP